MERKQHTIYEQSGWPDTFVNVKKQAQYGLKLFMRCLCFRKPFNAFRLYFLKLIIGNANYARLNIDRYAETWQLEVGIVSPC